MKNNIERQAKIRQLIRENAKRQILPALLKNWYLITGLALSDYHFLSLEESDKLISKFSFPYPGSQFENDSQELNAYAFASVLKGDGRLIDRVFQKLENKLKGHEFYIRLYNYDIGFIRLHESEMLKKWKELLTLDGSELWIYQPNTTNCLIVEYAEDYNKQNNEQGSWVYEISVTSKDWKQLID